MRLMRAFPLLFIAGLLLCLAPASARAQKLVYSPDSYDFGQVQIGESGSYSIQLANTGTTTVTISNISIVGGEFSYNNLPLPMQLAPWSGVELPITFTPTAAGSTDGVLTITSNALNSPATVDLSGTGTGGTSARLEVSPAALRFGDVTVGSSASLQATLTASGAAVVISSDRSTSPEFTILGLDLPVTIAAGQSLPVAIQFAPNSAGTDPAKVGFISNAANSPTVEHVTGTGVAQSLHYVYVSWNAELTAVGYNVFRGTSKAGPFRQINTALDASTNYTDNTVVAGTTYYYVATSVNAEGQESAYSSAVQAVIP
jgi:Abnormal spindle-like microcephaly-assoc'd, ASPM-SPD-2-Hydin